MMKDLESKLKTYRLSKDEYEKMKTLLGREPILVEWALFSALWSEHCSYKSSKIHLRKFGTTITDKVVSFQGENAGVLDLGYNEKVVFKMESHNHPSFIEPYQGAATGVGGILRDIFTMGARPIVLADYLCFGELSANRMTTLVDGVVRGISGYGNCVGVPTLSGQTNFDPAYNQNILVNAMAVGFIGENDRLALSKAEGLGNWVVYVGAKTGRDGVHGAAMASESFDENSESKRPNVQIGDPFYEKLLIESCLEVIQQDLVVAIQDMGAAGLTSSSFEMASKGQVGMRIDLSKVPLRDLEMGPEEILLSESQERMLLISTPQKFSEIQRVFSRYGLDATVIGEVIEPRVVELWWNHEKITAIDPDLLVENAPVYHRTYDKEWKSPNRKEKLVISQKSLSMNLEAELAKIETCSRKWIYRQYDQRVQARTLRGAEYDTAFHRLPSGRGLAVNVGCRPVWMKRDARIGALDAILYPSLQMAIKGASVVGVTDCLNFANPEKLQVMTEFVTSVESIALICEKMKIPVISGNVSFYNETLGQGIISTPATGLVGVCDDAEGIPEERFQKSGNEIFLVFSNDVRAFSGSNDFVGDLDLDKWAERTLATAEFVQRMRGRFVATKMVGSCGLLLTLAKMGTSRAAPWIQADLTLEDLSQDGLYAWVFEAHSADSDLLTRGLVKLGWVVKSLGTLGTENLCWKSHSWKMQGLKQSYEQAFGGALGSIS